MKLKPAKPKIKILIQGLITISFSIGITSFCIHNIGGFDEFSKIYPGIFLIAYLAVIILFLFSFYDKKSIFCIIGFALALLLNISFLTIMYFKLNNIQVLFACTLAIGYLSFEYYSNIRLLSNK